MNLFRNYVTQDNSEKERDRGQHYMWGLSGSRRNNSTYNLWLPACSAVLGCNSDHSRCTMACPGAKTYPASPKHPFQILKYLHSSVLLAYLEETKQHRLQVRSDNTHGSTCGLQDGGSPLGCKATATRQSHCYSLVRSDFYCNVIHKHNYAKLKIHL